MPDAASTRPISQLVPAAETGDLDREFAVAWYQSWVDGWNSYQPERLRPLVTNDFVLSSPTTRHTHWDVTGPDGAEAYMRYVIDAYPDLTWEVVAPPMYTDGYRLAAFSWIGTGHFSGTLNPPGIPGTGRAFEFSGLEVFGFRGRQACYLFACYDLIGLTKQIGIYPTWGGRDGA
jgi:SnoaL-like domain